MAVTSRLTEIDSGVGQQVRGLWRRAQDADGVAPVSEAFALALGPPRPGVVHLRRHTDDGAVAGYAQVAGLGSPDAVAELVVDPAQRRRGHGRALLDAVLHEGVSSVWAHGMLPAADALARAAGLTLTRSLHLMARPLGDDDVAEVALPPGHSSRAFVPGADDEAWVRLNADAFAGHPEQGRLTVADLHERMRQPWFDPAGLLLVTDDASGEVVAFHWTKVDPPPAVGAGAARSGTGEVYVVGVDPSHQGRGLGGPLTRLGLAHLAGLGLARVHLYVDGDNHAARRTYARLGFEDAATDGQYTRAGT